MAERDRIFEQAIDADDDNDDDGFALSVNCADPEAHGSFEEALKYAVTDGEIPNGQVRVVTVGHLRRHFALVHRPPPQSHWHVLLGTIPSTDYIDLFVDLFGPPQPNPNRPKGQP